MGQPDSRQAAGALARREALLAAAAYLGTLPLVQSGKLSQADLLALATGVSVTALVSEKGFTDGDKKGVVTIAEVRIETDGLEQRIRKLLENRAQFERFQDYEQHNTQLLEAWKVVEAEGAKLAAAGGPGVNQELRGRVMASTRRLGSPLSTGRR